jgi:hypothetical protein
VRGSPAGRFARRLVRLYPRTWRDRYEEEFVALLEESQGSVGDVFDVARGAMDAWMKPQVVSETSGGRLLMVARLRGSVLAVLWAWALLVVAGVGFQKMTEYDDFVRASRENAVVGAAFDAVVGGAVLALAAVLIGGVPIGFAAVRGALAEGRRDVPLLLSVPPLSLAAFVGYVLVLTKIIYPALGALAVHDAVNVALFLSVAGAFLVAAVVSVAAVSAAVGRSGVGERHLRFALASAAIAAVAMVGVLVGTVVWGLALRVQAPALFMGYDGILATPTYATWGVIVSAMFLSCLVAVVAVLRGLNSTRHPRSSVVS